MRKVLLIFLCFIFSCSKENIEFGNEQNYQEDSDKKKIEQSYQGKEDPDFVYNSLLENFGSFDNFEKTFPPKNLQTKSLRSRRAIFHCYVYWPEAGNVGKNFQLPDDYYIFESLEEQGLPLPYSCRAGACTTCACLLTFGRVDQSEQTILDDNQVERGIVVICVAHATSDISLFTHYEDYI